MTRCYSMSRADLFPAVTGRRKHFGGQVPCSPEFQAWVTRMELTLRSHWKFLENKRQDHSSFLRKLIFNIFSPTRCISSGVELHVWVGLSSDTQAIRRGLFFLYMRYVQSSFSAINSLTASPVFPDREPTMQCGLCVRPHRCLWGPKEWTAVRVNQSETGDRVLLSQSPVGREKTQKKEWVQWNRQRNHLQSVLKEMLRHCGVILRFNFFLLSSWSLGGILKSAKWNMVAIDIN